MCTMTSFTFDGHDYQLVLNTAERYTDIINAEMELVATITISPCGEYYISEAANDSNPLGMATYHHAGCTTLEDVALSAIAGSY